MGKISVKAEIYESKVVFSEIWAKFEVMHDCGRRKRHILESN
ncbi:MAG: hypothetical protein PHW03_06935 [Eubacteriales bacterium]|nr:hypothetical protein [Eubacteriales bacterium]MDD4390521.1 hypothetical protein [Eubacteriales bacterium]